VVSREGNELSRELIKSDTQSQLDVSLPSDFDDVKIDVLEYKSWACADFESYGQLSVQDDRNNPSGSPDQISLLFNGYGADTKVSPSVTSIEIFTDERYHEDNVRFEIIGQRKGTISLQWNFEWHLVFEYESASDAVFSYDATTYSLIDELRLTYGDSLEQYRIVEIYSDY